MAKPKKYPEVMALGINESVVIPFPSEASVKRSVADVKQKVGSYGNGSRRFSVESTINGVRVTRLPDDPAPLMG